MEYSERVFEDLVRVYAAFLERLGVKASRFIPASAATGDNLVSASERLPWYEGPTVLEAIEEFHSQPPLTAALFRVPVPEVYKFAKDGDQRRIVAGTVQSGRLRSGRRSHFLSVGKEQPRFVPWRRSIALHQWKHRPTRQSASRSPTSSVSGRGKIAMLAGQPAPAGGVAAQGQPLLAEVVRLAESSMTEVAYLAAACLRRRAWASTCILCPACDRRPSGRLSVPPSPDKDLPSSLYELRCVDRRLRSDVAAAAHARRQRWSGAHRVCAGGRDRFVAAVSILPRRTSGSRAAASRAAPGT